MENHIKTLEDTIERELTSTSTGLIQEYAQVGLEELLDNDAFKQLPIVKTFIGLTKGYLAVRDLLFARKLSEFLYHFQKGTNKPKDREQLLFQLQADPKKRNKIIEQVIVMNERYIDIKKSEVHANLLIAHLLSKLSWDELSDALNSLDVLNLKSLKRLSELANAEVPFVIVDNSRAFDGNIYASGIASLRTDSYVVDDLGRKLYYYGIKGDYDAIIPT